MATIQALEVEEIPGEDQVSRGVDSPKQFNREQQQFIIPNFWQFPSEQGAVESLIWRKYKPTIAEVHELGCRRQASKRRAGNEQYMYEGSVTACVADIREIHVRGHGFSVRHEPSEGIEHVQIGFAVADGVQFDRRDKSVLKDQLMTVFDPIEEHLCKDET